MAGLGFSLGVHLSPRPAVLSGGTPPPPPLPTVTVNGWRAALMGDSRNANGVQPQIGAFSTAVPTGTRVQGIPAWALQSLNYPVNVVAEWTQGGGKSSEFCHTNALAKIASFNPNVVFYLGCTNDPVDYVGAGPPTANLAPIALGDPDIDPSLNDRVGDTMPVTPAYTGQGTTLGNLDKMLRYFEALGIAVICWEIPTTSGSRKQRNADVHKWLQKHLGLGTYTNLIAPDLYNPLLATPGADDGATAGGIWRTDLNATVGQLSTTTDAAPTGDQLHPTAAGARFLGQTMAADTKVAAAFAGRPSQLLLPTGANNASFLNGNPYITPGTTHSTTFAGAGPAPTGTFAQNWTPQNDIAGGTSSVVGSLHPSGHGQRLTITRTGGSGVTSSAVRLRGQGSGRAIVAGERYVVHSEIVIPARAAQDIYSARAFFNYFEPGLKDEAGNDIQAGEYTSFAPNNPQLFVKNGQTLISVSVPLIITPNMVATVTGNLVLTPILEILLVNNADTSVNGAIVVDFMSCGLQRIAP